MFRRLAERPGLVFALVLAWKVALVIFTAQPVPANDAFFYDGPVVNFLLHGKFVNPSLSLVLPISGNEVFCAYPPLYHVVLLGWMSIFGTSALAAMWLHVLLFGVYELIALAILRRLQTPAPCVNLAGLFLLAISFHDRPDSLAHVLGMAALYACVRSRPSLAVNVGRINCGGWAWIAAGLTTLTLGTSLQIGVCYLALVWLVLLMASFFGKEKLPIGAMISSVLAPAGLIALTAFGFPHLCAGFLEHARLTPSATGLRLPQSTEVLKVVRTVPGILVVALLFVGLLRRRKEIGTGADAPVLLVTGACTMAALVVVAASLFAVTANMVAIAAYLQPLVVGGYLASLSGRTAAKNLPTCTVALVVGLAVLVSIRPIGMTTWGVACATDVSYAAAVTELRGELQTMAPQSAVVVSSAYLYETARHDVRWIHSDWPGKPEFTNPDWERNGIVALKPAKLIVTQFDYYRRYQAVLAGLKGRPDLVEIKIRDTAKIPPPDSMKAMQRVVQHVSWAPVVVDFSWR